MIFFAMVFPLNTANNPYNKPGPGNQSAPGKFSYTYRYRQTAGYLQSVIVASGGIR